MQKGILYVDVFLMFFVAITVFFVFYYLMLFNPIENDDLIENLIVTQNAMSKNNEKGVGYAEFSSSEKLIKSNFISGCDSFDLTDSVDGMIIETVDGLNIREENPNCQDEKMMIERYGYCGDSIAKFIFVFCE